MRAVKVTLSKELTQLEIHTFSDWHIGDRFCDMQAIKEQIRQVTENPNAYAICNGDLVNMATKASVSDCYAEEYTPMEQLSTLIGLLEPIKDKILMMTTGNHEERTYKTDGIDFTGLVAKQLGIADRYCREGGVLFLRFGEQDAHNNYRSVNYTFYVSHGSGGGKKEGSKVIRLAEMASIVDTDIYLHAHTHLPVVLKEGFWRVDSRGSSVFAVDKLFVNTAAQLNYGGYGQKYGFKPNSKHNPVIYLNGKRKEFYASL